ncbi:MAG: hypothetical protein Pg6B_07260 [Candidatus Azobacteroides pseudotrichonymphae]|jgi:hypothetical protein|nr:MAG: hypothetical protein Pg6B_07260 [Candidatus Azobacteroides pseudotrichonymphae]
MQIITKKTAEHIVKDIAGICHKKLIASELTYEINICLQQVLVLKNNLSIAIDFSIWIR